MRSIGWCVALALLAGCAGARNERRAQAPGPEARVDPAEAPASPPVDPDQPLPPGAGEPIAIALPPEDEATWIAPEIRAVAEALQQSDTPPTALFYVGGTTGPGCLELYTFRFFYGTRDRWADVAGFADEAAARRCEEIARAASLPVPERIGAFFVQFSDAAARDALLQQALRTQVAALAGAGATPIPRDAVPFGAQPDTVVRRRHPPPAR